MEDEVSIAITIDIFNRPVFGYYKHCFSLTCSERY